MKIGERKKEEKDKKDKPFRLRGSMGDTHVSIPATRFPTIGPPCPKPALRWRPTASILVCWYDQYGNQATNLQTPFADLVTYCLKFHQHPLSHHCRTSSVISLALQPHLTETLALQKKEDNYWLVVSSHSKNISQLG